MSFRVDDEFTSFVVTSRELRYHDAEYLEIIVGIELPL